MSLNTVIYILCRFYAKRCNWQSSTMYPWNREAHDELWLKHKITPQPYKHVHILLATMNSPQMSMSLQNCHYQYVLVQNYPFPLTLHLCHDKSISYQLFYEKNFPPTLHSSHLTAGANLICWVGIILFLSEPIQGIFVTPAFNMTAFIYIFGTKSSSDSIATWPWIL